MKKRGKIAPDSGIWISLKPRYSYGAEFTPYEEIHIHSGDEKVREKIFSEKILAKKLWSKNGYLCSDSVSQESVKERFKRAVSHLRKIFDKCPEIVVSENVHKLLNDIDEDISWRVKIDASISSRGGFQEWENLKKELSIKLYDYQQEGVLFSVRNRRSFIGDDMGLGKTVQAIASVLLFKKLAGMRKVVIFCPASLKFQWKREIEKISGEKAEIVQGNRLFRENVYKKSSALFLVVNYELIFRDEDLLRELNPDMIILDEAQRIKNWETKTAKGIKRLKSKFALILTGTPFENKLIELHSLCEFLHLRALGPMWRLLPTYGNLDRNDKLVGYSNLSHLRQKIAPFFLRREKDKVLSQLPERIVNEYAVEISSVQKDCHEEYKVILAKLMNIRKKRPLTPKELKRVFMCLTCMRIISNAYAQYDWKKYAHIIDGSNPISLKEIRCFHSPKLLEFRSIMEDLLERPKDKFVIFSQWERMLLLAEASIRDLLMEKGFESVIFSGSLPTPKRGAVVGRFIEDTKLKIFFSTDAGGLGLNLQEAASNVINLDMPWNPAVLEQRIGRVHRIGQKNSVNVINLISTDCIEERVYEAVCKKRQLFDGVFKSGTDGIEFDKDSSFIDKIVSILGDDLDKESDHAPNQDHAIDEDVIWDAATEVETEIFSQESEPPKEESFGKNIDITGIFKALGSWVGDGGLASLKPQSLQLDVRHSADEISLAIKKPPKELILGIKELCAAVGKALEG